MDNISITITKDGAYEEYPYRCRLYENGKLAWEDDFPPITSIEKVFSEMINRGE